MRPISRLALAFRGGFGRITPDPFVLAIALTLGVMAVAILHRPETGLEAVEATLGNWSGSAGLWKLLAFGMQASLMLVLGTAVADAPPVRRRIEALAARAKTPRALVALVAFAAILLGLVNWSLALIGGALLARSAGVHARRQGWQLDFPLLAAAGYSGLMVWHGGLSGTAPLKATTPKDLVEVLGEDLAGRVGTLGLEQTLLGDLNLFVSGGLLVLGPLLFMAMVPASSAELETRHYEGELSDDEQERAEEPTSRSTLEQIETSPWVLRALALPMFAALAFFVARKGLGRVGLDTVNLTLWVAAMALHGRPDKFVQACERGIRGATGIFIQFPLYAGIMGMMSGAGLSRSLAEVVSTAGPDLLAPLTFASAALINLFVPSGGGQWAVQGPIIMESALRTGVEPARVLMAMAYGDQLTNMLQPFWALPLLAITGCKAREIVGYCMIFMLVGAAWMTLGLVLFV
jgi:short-chain fatty acids transporter